MAQQDLLCMDLTYVERLCMSWLWLLYVSGFYYISASLMHSDGKESACNAGDPGLIPRLGRSPGGGHSNPLQCSWLENPQGPRSLVGYSPRGRKGSGMTERLHWCITGAWLILTSIISVSPLLKASVSLIPYPFRSLGRLPGIWRRFQGKHKYSVTNLAPEGSKQDADEASCKL